MLPVETLKLLQDTVRAAEPGKRIVKAPAEPDHVYYVVDEDGSMVRMRAENPPFDALAADLETIAADPKPDQVWYSRATVVALHRPGPDDSEDTSEGTPPDRRTLALSPSPQLAFLAQYERTRGHFSQADFVLALRTVLADCYPDHPQLLASVRGVRMQVSTDNTQAIAHGKVSVGKALMAEMTGVGAIPEEVTFTVPVFSAATVPYREKVRVAIDLNPKDERFTLIVLPGQIEAAYAGGEARVAARLRELLGKDVPLYHGSPDRS